MTKQEVFCELVILNGVVRYILESANNLDDDLVPRVVGVLKLFGGLVKAANRDAGEIGVGHGSRGGRGNLFRGFR